MQANSQLLFAEEFESLKNVGRNQSKDVAGEEVNVLKNRYSNIRPYDISRVKISACSGDNSDYINASWIPGYFSRRQYIATQGPLDSTLDDFWRMIWEYNVKAIVMITRLVEEGKIKCCQYWPSDDEVVLYGDIAVKVASVVTTEHWVVREMSVSLVSCGQECRLVKHCFYTSWPDMKTPEESQSIINYIRMVRGCFSVRGSSPLVVHCSAGVGRTGTFIGLDTALYQLEEEEMVDIYGAVYKMRLNRAFMVQNEKQYIYIYLVVKDMIQAYLRKKERG
ncbi:hypothetical protein HELRODRAFT_107832 [Helobdella robusta]|uniref:Protein-tyrosine-phosphatase n=1 Tax=Helobdella robusta TaxID=6412 RepID=T1EED1_HELRO|nr:hypothetical protein HELRODRAFT_107832 [Helobdella robusta]ESN94564.1 hypothetical protein HELRODRAFT_107832 [Helobdella robusta]